MRLKHGFELVEEREITELNTTAQLYRHVKTGAELLSLQNDDENKVFGITFRTPPTDSTGLPHIMEHSVLGGSRKFQLKEPFVELVKGSLKTFVNAMTFPDQTSYPVASQNVQDLYNLIDVYLDAVFHPLITPHHLQQEGWHYELEDAADPLIYKGVVFNEMKGAYSSPDNVLYRHSKMSLFPDNTYGFDSGGDPDAIPDLTYAQFKSFHDVYYHPSNARIFFYGDDDPEERLRFLNTYLDEFEARQVESTIAVHPPFREPKRLRYPYSVDAGTDSTRKGMVQMNWALPETADPALRLALHVLSYCLVGTQASPLRKKLLDTGLGDDVTGGGLAGQMRQLTFGVGLKGIAVEKADEVEAIILQTLADLAADGFDSELVEAAVNTFEFNLRENNTGSFPRGLSLMFRSMATWLYDGDPFSSLAYEAPLAAVKSSLETRKEYLQELIETYLLKNMHRTTILLEPDPKLSQEMKLAEKERLASVKERMTPAEIERVIEETRALKRAQEMPDSAEALASIPQLKLADLDKQSRTIPIVESQAQGATILYHDLFTNGIVYLDVGLDMRTLPQDLLPYVGLFGKALVQMGTEKEDYVKLSQRIGRKTGGIAPSQFTSPVKDDVEGRAFLFLRGKAMGAQAQDMLDIMRDVLLTVKLDNQERFRQIVQKTRAGREAGLIPSGHSVVNGRLRARFNKADWVSEQIGGLSNLFFLRELTRQIDEDWPSVLARLEAVRQTLLNRNAMLCNVTVDQEEWAGFSSRLDEFLAALPAQPVTRQAWQPDLLPKNEGLTIPAQVNYVGKGANLYDLGYRLDGSVAVITNYLRTTWLWEKVRVQGGAYGGFCAFDRQSGVFSQLSYRDPNLLETLANYDGSSDFLRHLDLSQGELTKSIIGAIGALDAYQLPDAKGYTSMVRYIVGLTDAQRQAFRDQVLSATVADFRAFGDVLAEANEPGLVVVLGSAEKIAAANDGREGWLEITNVM